MHEGLQLLGPPKLHEGGGVISPTAEYPFLLVSYLALHQRWISRGELAALFWPEEAEKDARHNLSQLLYRCRKIDWFVKLPLESEPQRLRCLLPTDVEYFRDAFARGDWAEALRLYTGELLKGIRVSVSAYDDWLEVEREALHCAWREAALKQARRLETAGHYSSAAAIARDVLQHDPLAEDVLQIFIRSSLREGQRDLALSYYSAFAKQLADELDMSPLAETQALIALVDEPSAPVSLAVDSKQHSLSLQPIPDQGVSPPASLTAFVGRQRELTTITTQLNNPACRLLTLLGPGGVGKSRLALQVAQYYADQFTDGAVFIPLAALEQPDHIVPAIAEALQLPLTGGRSPLEELQSLMRDKVYLLILDNFEHLTAAAPSVLTLLETSPKSKVLVTSREPLNLRGEWHFELSGLSFPKDTVSPLESSEATELFLRTSNRYHPRFQLTMTERQAIVRICQLLGGLPLAIELAAAWTRVLTPSEIVQQLDKSFDLLEGTQHDLPERHRSLRAVFEHSWQLLSPKEQQLLAELSVFRGGFSKDAVVAVTDASLGTLLSLVNKSLLYRDDGGRFYLLETVRQYAAEKAPVSECMTWHARYYRQLVEQAQAETAALGMLTLERDNIRAALSWLIKTTRTQEALRLAGAMGRYWHVHGYLHEGYDWLSTVLALPTSEQDHPLRAEALRAIGILSWMLAKHVEAQRHFEAGIVLFEAQNDRLGVARLRSNLGLVAYMQQEYVSAKTLFESALMTFEALDETANSAGVMGNLSLIAYLQGDFQQAEVLAELVLERFRMLGESWGIATALNNLGRVQRQQGNTGQAEQLLKEALELAYKMEAKRILASIMEQLGMLHIQRAELPSAVSLWGAAEALREATGAAREPVDQVDYDRLVAQAKTQLSHSDYLHFWQQGRTLPLPELVDAMRHQAT